MSDLGERVATLENEVESIEKNIDEIHTSQKEILDSYHRHEIESERYRLLIDEIIEEKRAKVARIEAITEKLITRGVIAAIGLVLLLTWAGFKAKVGG